jgi:hypothetical protein
LHFDHCNNNINNKIVCSVRSMRNQYSSSLDLYVIAVVEGFSVPASKHSQIRWMS